MKYEPVNDWKNMIHYLMENVDLFDDKLVIENRSLCNQFQSGKTGRMK